MPRLPTCALLLLLASVSGCGDRDAAPKKATTERERDSVLGQSKIPGATGVGKAMTVADSAGNRVHVQDSVASSE
jgi:hypothetical protein